MHETFRAKDLPLSAWPYFDDTATITRVTCVLYRTQHHLVLSFYSCRIRLFWFDLEAQAAVDSFAALVANPPCFWCYYWQEDLGDLGVVKGHRKIILAAVKKLRVHLKGDSPHMPSADDPHA